MKPALVIIGGGPAGAAAGIALARSGRQVHLFEKKHAACDKVCGEFISGEAVAALAHLGTDLPALGAVPISQLRLIDGRRVLTAELPFTGWSLSRRRLDEALLSRARLEGVEVHMGVKVRSLTQEQGRWSVRVMGRNRESDGAQGENAGRVCETVHPETVFLATGKHDVRGWRRTAPASGTELIGMKMHLQLSDAQTLQLRSAVELYLFDEGYAGLELVEGGRANLCFLIRKQSWQRSPSWSGVVGYLCRQSPGLAQRLSGSVSVWGQPLSIAGIPYGYLATPETAIPGLFRLGDQAAVIPSLAGDGIAMALCSAELATQVFLRGGNTKDYQHQVRSRFRRSLALAGNLSRLLSNPAGRRLAFVVASFWPGLMQTMVRRTRVDVI